MFRLQHDISVRTVLSVQHCLNGAGLLIVIEKFYIFNIYASSIALQTLERSVCQKSRALNYIQIQFGVKLSILMCVPKCLKKIMKEFIVTEVQGT